MDNDYELATAYRDSGVSAFKGQNAAVGMLAGFKAACEAGDIPIGSWLVIESLDRLSRHEIIAALQLFIDLMKFVNIHTCIDRKSYAMGAEQSVIMGDLSYCLAVFSRAHEESLIKQSRTIAAAKREIQKAQEGNFAIKSVGSNVWWVDDRDGTIKKHEIFFDVARSIVDLLLKGYGYIRILKYLNSNCSVIPRTASSNPLRNNWPVNLINRFHKSHALYGRKEIKLSGETYRIEDYYPPLCTKEEFFKIQHLKNLNRSTTTTREYVPLLSGKRIFKCGLCGESMSSLRMNGVPRYMCIGGQSKKTNCSAWSVKADWVDRAFIDVCVPIFSDYGFGENESVEAIDYDAEISILNKKLSVISRIVSASKNMNDENDYLRQIDFIDEKIKAFESLKDKEARQKVAIQEAKDVGPEKWISFDNRLLDLKNDEIRQSFKDYVAKIVSRIKISKNKSLYDVAVTTVSGQEICFTVGNGYLKITTIDFIVSSKERAIAFALRLFTHSGEAYRQIDSPYYLMSCVAYCEKNSAVGWLLAAHEWATINFMKNNYAKVKSDIIESTRRNGVVFLDALGSGYDKGDLDYMKLNTLD